ncbi:MAG: SPOR domain-containing protein [Desulfobacterales bacterium]
MPETKKKRFDSIRHGNTMWIGIIFFASAWMFVLGVFVGRGTAPVKFDMEKLRNELIALKKTVIDEDKKRFDLFMETAKRKTNLGFYEALRGPKEEDNADQPLLKKTTAGPAQKLAASGEPEKNTSSATRKTVSGPDTGNLTIQVGSFREMATADQVVAELKGEGYRAYRIVGKVSGRGVWYRVRIGYYANTAEAQETIQRLKKNKYNPLLIKWQ